MSIINKGTSFANGEQLTADKINDLIDLATFNQDATDSQTTDVNSAGQIVVNQGGIDTAQLATGAVTKSKIENVADMKALGNTSGSASEPREVAILDENDMSSDSATSLATQQSIKAYVDGEITDHGITQTTGTAPYFGCRCFGIFNGTLSTPITPESSGNVASIVRTSTGYFEVSFTTPMADANYSVVVTGNHQASITYAVNENLGFRQTGKFQIFFGSSSSLYNPDRISFAVFG